MQRDEVCIVLVLLCRASREMDRRPDASTATCAQVGFLTAETLAPRAPVSRRCGLLRPMMAGREDTMATVAMPTDRITAELTASEIRALTLWKRRYVLEVAGFTRSEADGIMFTAWRTSKLDK